MIHEMESILTHEFVEVPRTLQYVVELSTCK